MVDYKTIFSGTPAGPVALAAIESDAQHARLSRKYRAYYRLRPFIPIALRQRLQKTRRIEVGPDWYLPTAFIGSITRALQGCEPISIIHPWPDAARFALVLTHDVETSDGVKNIPQLAAIEEELGFRSSWNIVPQKYRVDPGMIRDLKNRRFEIGIHGYNHDGRLYSSQVTFRRRAAAINRAIDEYGAVGFRSPMVHRNVEWLQDLNIHYDASCFDIDPFQAMPGGAGSIWPFQAGRFVELPYTLPQDHTLLIALRSNDCEIWHRKLDFLIRHHGLALMLTHPDYLDSPARLDMYRSFLTSMRDRSNYWHATPAEATAWWNQRAESKLAMDEKGNLIIRGPAQERGRVATINAVDNELTIQSESLSIQFGIHWNCVDDVNVEDIGKVKR